MCEALTADELAALRESIRAHGVRVPIAVDQHGGIIDGHHRKRIAAELGITYKVDVHEVADEAEAHALAWTLNADRRQMSVEYRRKRVAELRAEGMSARVIGEAVGASEATVRRDLATASPDAVAPDRIVGRDGRSRPATRAKSRKPTQAIPKPKIPNPLPATTVPATVELAGVRLAELALSLGYAEELRASIPAWMNAWNWERAMIAAAFVREGDDDSVDALLAAEAAAIEGLENEATAIVADTIGTQ